jgi:hypothetical protein
MKPRRNISSQLWRLDRIGYPLRKRAYDDAIAIRQKLSVNLFINLRFKVTEAIKNDRFT